MESGPSAATPPPEATPTEDLAAAHDQAPGSADSSAAQSNSAQEIVMPAEAVSPAATVSSATTVSPATASPAAAASPATASPAATVSSALTTEPLRPAEGQEHPVRERLLAKARAAREQRHGGGTENLGRSAPVAEDDVATGLFSQLTGFNEELEKIARSPGGARRAPRGVHAGAPLTANTVAIFGTLFGMATVVSLFALLIQLVPRTYESSITTPAASLPSAAALAPEQEEAPVPQPSVRKKVPGPWRISDNVDTGQKRVEGKIGTLPFLKAVQEAGVELKQAYRLVTALKDIKDLNKCGKNDQFIALIDRKTLRVTAFEYVVSKEEIYQAREQANGLLAGQRLDLEVQRNQLRAALIIDGTSFAEAAVHAGFDASLGAAVNKALEGHTSVEQFQRGDRVRLVVQEVVVLGEFARYAGIEAIEYLPNGDDEGARVYYMNSSQTRGYVNAKGMMQGEGGWRRPVRGAPITSRFNPKRLHPILKVVKPHTGTDFGAPVGTPVYATLYGTVTFVGYAGPNGNFVSIDHKNRHESGYSHLSRFADGLKVGDNVKTLQLIGYVGSTGRSTGPHLHFSIKKNDKFIDAESLHLDALVAIPAADRELFGQLKAKYDALLDRIELPAPLPPTQLPSAALLENQADIPGAEALASPGGALPLAAPPAGEQPTPPTPLLPQPGPRGTSIYLSDQDLLKSQPSIDDGEVED